MATAEQAAAGAASDVAAPGPLTEQSWHAGRSWRSPSPWAVGAAAAVLAVAAVRVAAVWRARHAGHADPSYYYQLGQNLRHGHGLTIDYVWHFLPAPTSLHHYAPDYWMPFASIVMGVLSPVGGVRGSLLVCVAAAALASAAAYWLARELTAQRWVAAAAAVLVAVSPETSRMAVETDSTVFVAALSTAALAAMLSAPRRRWGWPLAGFLVALAMLSRSDAILLGAPLLVAIVLGEDGARQRVRAVGQAGAALVLTMLPLLVSNVIEMHRLLPASISQGMFISSLEDLYSYRSTWSLHTWLAQSVHHRLDVRFQAVRLFRTEPWRNMGHLALALLVVGAVARLVWGLAIRTRRVGGRRRSPWIVPAVLVATQFVVLTQVTPMLVIGGTWTKSLPLLITLALIAALDGIGRVAETIGARFERGAVAAAVSVVIVALLVGGPWATTVSRVANADVAKRNGQGDQIAQLAPLLRSESKRLGHRVVVMTRSPWELNEVTGFAAVMVPNDDLATIVSVAARYHVDYLLLPAPRAALADVDALTGPGKTFELVAHVHHWTVLRFTYR